MTLPMTTFPVTQQAATASGGDRAPAAAVPAARRVVALTTADEIAALRPQWEALRPGPRADPDSFLAVVSARRAIHSPYVLAMMSGDTLDALLVARLEEHDYVCRFAYRTVCSTRVRAIAVQYGGALRATPSTPWAPLVAALDDAVRGGVAAAVHLRRLEEDSDLLRDVRARVPWTRRNESEAPALHWSVDLPATFDAFLARTGSRARKSLRRDRRALDRDFPGTVVFRRTTAPSDVAGFCRRAETVACCTYQRGLDVGFVHDREYESRLAAAARRGGLRAYELEVGGRVCAFWIGESYDGTHHVDSTGFAPEFARWSPGKLLRLEVTRDLIAEGATRMDFGFGDAEYKRHFGARSRREHDVYVLAPGLRGAWLNAVRWGTTRASRAAQAVVRRARVADALRRALRRRAADRVAGAPPSAGDEGDGG